MKSRPNFFIIGAPKCGTTSLAAWLRSHPQIFLSQPKEPHFFSNDMRISGAIREETVYLKLFSNTTSKHRAIGEASTSYLRSQVAVRSILRLIPDAKFIVCLRNPLEMVASAHTQLVKSGRETELSLAAAWEKQDARLNGSGLPDWEDPGAFQYRSLCSLGEQLERLFLAVARENVCAVLLEDMKQDPRAVYRNVLRFLGVEEDGRDCFPVENPRQQPRIPFVAQATRRLGVLKQRIGCRRGTGLGDTIQRWNNRHVMTSQLTPEMVDALRDYFGEDIKKLERLLDRDLRGWLK